MASTTHGRAKRLVAALILLAALGCGGGPSEAEQARQLLAAISALDPTAEADARQRQLSALETLPLRSPALAKTREHCLVAHRGLLQAEQQQQQARAALDKAAARHKDAGIPPAETQSIAELIARSNQTLAAAQKALPDCDRSTMELATRYR